MRLNAIAYYADFYLSGFLILALFGGIIPAEMRGDGLAATAVWISAAVSGAVIWTFAEYLIHRFIYHRVPFFREAHDAHHAEPNEFIGAPPLIGIAIIFTIGFAPLIAFGLPLASGATAGLLAGYLGYMVVHHADHYWKPEPGTALYRLRRHHALHHYRSDEGNFGIVTSFWDHVFGTALKPVSDRAGRQPA